MSSCSPGYAITLSLRGTALDPEHVMMGSADTKHDGCSGSLQGLVECRDAGDGKGARQRRGEGSGGIGSGQLRRTVVV